MSDPALPVPLADRHPVPAAICDAGPAARFAWDEFFSGQLRNKHSKAAYRRAVVRFLTGLEPSGCELTRVTPGMIGGYLDSLPLAAASRKVELAALRRFFDLLVVRHVVVLNPAHSVRGERIAAVEGSTPEIATAQTRQLLRSIETDTLIGLRDRAVIGCLAFTAARAGAVAKLARGGLQMDGTHYRLRFHEKNVAVR